MLIFSLLHSTDTPCDPPPVSCTQVVLTALINSVPETVSDALKVGWIQKCSMC